MVVKVSGGCVEDGDAFGDLWRELGSYGPGGLVIVHGGGRAISEALEREGIASDWVGGLRVTTQEHLEIVAQVLCGKVNVSLCAALVRFGVQVSGTTLVCCGSLRVRLVEGLGRVGTIEGGSAEIVEAMLEEGIVPVVAPIAMAEDGGLVNVNGDDAAGGLARAIGARGLLLLSDVSGVMDEDGRIIDELDGDRCEALIEHGVIADGMVAKVRAALRVSAESRVDVTIASYHDVPTVGRILEGRGGGTVIRASQGVA